jgi:hypothetical protein
MIDTPAGTHVGERMKLVTFHVGDDRFAKESSTTAGAWCR